MTYLDDICRGVSIVCLFTGVSLVGLGYIKHQEVVAERNIIINSYLEQYEITEQSIQEARSLAYNIPDTSQDLGLYALLCLTAGITAGLRSIEKNPVKKAIGFRE